MRRVVRCVHLWVAVIGGLLLSIVTVSGSFSVFRPEIDRLHAQAPGPLGERADLDAVVATLQAAHPDVRIQRLVTPASYGGSVFEWMLIDDKGTRERDDDESWKVYTDPSTGAVLGSNRGSSLSATVAWIARFHHNLWLGQTGGVLVGISGFCLFIFIVSGIWLWWTGFTRWRTAFALRWSKGWHLRHYDLHKLIGLMFIPLFLLTALTGTMFEFRWMRTFVHAAFGGSAEELPLNLRPSPAATPSEAAASPEAKAATPRTPDASNSDNPPPRRAKAENAEPSIGWNEAARRAETSVGGSLLSISPPRRGRNDPVWQVVLDHPNNVGSNSGIVVRLTPIGSISDVVDTRGMSLGGKISNQLWGLHVGTWGGLTSRLLHVLSGFMPPILLVTGFALWWIRHRRRTSTTSLTPVPIADVPASPPAREDFASVP